MPEQLSWPYKDVAELITTELRSGAVQLSRWREDADRSIAFSDLPDFLCATDQQGADIFEAYRSMLAAPYPRATAAECYEFAQVVELVESLHPSLLILLNQNLLLRDEGRRLLDLLQSMPNLDVTIHSGWAGILDLFEGKPNASRIKFASVPIDPYVFHGAIAQRFGFALPDWFYRRNQSS